MTWLEAIKEVLSKARSQGHYELDFYQITEKILDQGLKDASNSQTPWFTVNRELWQNVKSANPFVVALGGGRYKLKEESDQIDNQEQESIVNDDAIEQGLIKAYGLVWLREHCDWRKQQTLVGHSELRNVNVCFDDQAGVYLLYENSQIVYAGRADLLKRRLEQHTKDRLQVRWNRFSWFGFKDVLDDSTLGGFDNDFESVRWQRMFSSFEALLIAAIEPKLNLQRGFDMSKREYLQTKTS